MRILSIHDDYLLYRGKDGYARSVSFAVLVEERENDFNAFLPHIREEYRVIYDKIMKIIPEKLL